LAYHRFSPHLFPLPSSLQSIDGASVEDLSLDWTMPGSPELELVTGGSELSVTDANVHVWIWMVAQQMINEGVLIQLMCMQQGLRVCLDTSKLLAFYPHGQCFSAPRASSIVAVADICCGFSCVCVCAELEELVSGGGSFGSKLLPWDWSEAKLRTVVKFRGGYGPDSPAVRWLLTIMSQFTPQQQRMFTKFITGTVDTLKTGVGPQTANNPNLQPTHCIFVSSLPCMPSLTGSPSLPGGQIQSLNPPLTVVKIDLKHGGGHEKDSSDAGSGGAINLTHSPAVQPASSPPPPASMSLSADSAPTGSAPSSYLVLPSVMTCSHYLKVRRTCTLRYIACRKSKRGSCLFSGSSACVLTAACCLFSQLPNYPSLEVMLEKILVAITEGSQGFTLT
jgi:hypothetical protein